MDFDSDSDELTELLQAAAEAGEITLGDNVGINSTTVTGQEKVSENGVNITQTAEKKINTPLKLTEGAYDSSDEEDMQNFFERKYNEYGRDLNTMIKRKDADRIDSIIGKEVNEKLRQSKLTTIQDIPTQPRINEKTDNFYTDPIFGLRLIRPLISSTTLRERMIGRKSVEIRYLQNYLHNADLSKDWCISGVIVNKGPVQISNAGSQYVIWRLSDLKGEIKTVSLFLFKSAYKELWKTAQGMIIAVLNPSVFSRKDNNGESSLSIDSAQRVMILGHSKDYGICKSKKKNGEPCTAIVNSSACEFCVYHVKQEYGKMSGRSELQSATSGRGLQALKNKVLGRSEVFYGGKSFMAEPAKPSQKLQVKDRQRLMSLSDGASSLATTVIGIQNFLGLFIFPVFNMFVFFFIFIGGNSYLANNTRSSKIAETVESNSSQRRKDLERLKSLNVNVSFDTSQSTLSSMIKANQIQPMAQKIAPSLSRESFSFTVGKPISANNSAAKAKAITILQKKPIEKSNPNYIKYRGTEAGKKRLHSAIESEEENSQKKQKMADEVEKFKNERIKQLMAARSSHIDLIEAHEMNVKDQYFNKLEKKEAMEEKMLNTTKLDCKAGIYDSICSPQYISIKF